jgi:bifunctional DNA-binding transcriptional regulator/antitoxin component of YhaV-PrlF toxin-antitoxin module
MVKFTTTVDKNGRIYIAKLLRQSFLVNTLEILPNAKAAVIYKADTPVQDVLASLEIIMADLRYRAKLGAEIG